MKYLVPAVLVLIGILVLVGCAKRPLSPVTPWADVANDSLSFFTVSADPGDLKVCYVFDWGDGDTTTTSFSKSGDTICCSHEFAGAVVRYIKVKARNEKGVESDWSPSLRFHSSQPPQVVDTIVGLPRWAVDRWYHASVRVTDPDGDSVAVRFVWGDLPAAGWSAFVPSGSVVTDSCKWSVIGPHTVRVVLRDKGCTVSCPSEVKTVNVSSMAVTWYKSDSATDYDATPTLGMIGGEPVLYCGLCDVLDCYTLDGRLLWSVPTSGSGCAPSLSPDGSRLYLTGDNGISCLDARTGHLKWNLPLGASEEALCTPTLGPDGAIYVTTSGPDDYWLDRVTDYGDSAAFRWSTCFAASYAASENGTVVGRNGVVYTVGQPWGDYNSILFAIDSTGTVLWKDSTHISLGGAPVIDSRDRVLVTDWDGGFCCLNPDGTLAYCVTGTGLSPGSTAVGPDDEVIVTDGVGCVSGYDATGRLLWTSALIIYGTTTPCVAQDGTIILYDAYGNCVYNIDSTGLELWEYSIWDSLGFDERRSARPTTEGDGCPSPVIGPNGDLYLASSDGIFCLSGANLHMANTAWPTYNHDAARSGWAGRP